MSELEGPAPDLRTQSGRKRFDHELRRALPLHTREAHSAAFFIPEKYGAENQTREKRN